MDLNIKMDSIESLEMMNNINGLLRLIVLKIEMKISSYPINVNPLT